MPYGLCDLHSILAHGKDITAAAVWGFHMGVTSEKLFAQIDYDELVRRSRGQQSRGLDLAAATAVERRQRREFATTWTSK